MRNEKRNVSDPFGLAGGDTDASVNARGDWVDGQGGNDILIGTAAKDLLTGGDDNDLLIGGAGDDLLLGDASLQQAYADWSVDRNVSPPDSVTGVVTYQWTINRGTTTGSDSIGGAGDDMLISADIADRLSGGGGDTKSRRWRDGGLRRRAGRIAKVGAGETAGNDGQWRIAA